MEKLDRLRLALLAVAVTAVVAVAILLAIGVSYLVDDAERGAETRTEIQKTLGLLVECTTDPAERKAATKKVGEDDCFVRAQDRTAKTVGQIGDISVVAAACGAANPGDVSATRLCVEEALEP